MGGPLHSTHTHTHIAIPLSLTVGVWVSHVVTPEEFYIQYKDEETILQRVSYQLNEIVNSEPNFAATFILTISEITEGTIMLYVCCIYILMCAFTVL